ncbi:MAG TPA: MltA domain-containing protein [Phycisphaerae bacterium]|nr:murein transglycosylase [Phycisphaerae bacterium]HOB74381.1 MltA domain-containing protein [Phycisphaerae bacterium]HOJ54500.1 MltA domain-containing protein [Phycisphaerae bacterium]HOL26529.1 MltA domain-containing protein [Phycisphaerae bacterium]HPP20928.1 MltA domain-containing protein [Phycisphaerae bacterium]
MRRTLGLLLPCIAILVLTTGCPKKPTLPPVEQQPDYSGKLPEGEKALVKIDPSMYPDFSQGFDHRSNLIEAALYSRQYLEKKSSRQFFPYLDISHQRAIDSIDAFIEVLQTAQSGQELDQMIRERFDVYQSRGYQDYNRKDADPRWKPPDTGIVLFTGYYRPIFNARLKPDAVFKYPLYKKPPDLMQDPVTLAYQPYLTRAQIENGALAGRGLELCYLSDWFETYIVTIQGSAKLRLEDGSMFEIGYAGDNGHKYESVAQAFVQQGRLDANNLSLQSMIQYFRQHPEAREQAININPRYVFFTPRSGGPFGSLNVPVTPLRSIATDKQIFPRAGVCFIKTQLPFRDATGQIRQGNYGGFALDQDTGGAIQAAGRCDVFMGTGDEVGELAGRTFSEGALYYIYVKEGMGSGTATSASPQAPYDPAPEATGDMGYGPSSTPPTESATTPYGRQPQRRLASGLPPS